MKKGATINTGNGGVTLSDVGGETFVKTSFALVVNVERIGSALSPSKIRMAA